MKLIVAGSHFEKDWKDIYKHEHLQEYQIDYFALGKGRYWLEDSWEKIDNGSLFFVSPNIQHDIDCDTNVPLDNISIKFSLEKKEQLKDFPSFFKINIPVKYKERFYKKMKKILGYYILGREISDDYLSYCLGVIKNLIIEKQSMPVSTEEKIENTKNILEQNYSLPITLSWLSKKVKLNSYYLCRKFKEITHQNIFEYLNKIRMENSIILLKSKDMPIKQVSSMCGFKNVHYFSTTFKRYFSTSPGKIKDGIK